MPVSPRHPVAGSCPAGKYSAVLFVKNKLPGSDHLKPILLFLKQMSKAGDLNACAPIRKSASCPLRKNKARFEMAVCFASGRDAPVEEVRIRRRPAAAYRYISRGARNSL